MKKLFILTSLAFCTLVLNSCCKCMNCPDFAANTGADSDVICQQDYENDPYTTMSWAQYSDYMIQTGCKCID